MKKTILNELIKDIKELEQNTPIEEIEKSLIFAIAMKGFHIGNDNYELIDNMRERKKESLETFIDTVIEEVKTLVEYWKIHNDL